MPREDGEAIDFDIEDRSIDPVGDRLGDRLGL